MKAGVVLLVVYLCVRGFWFFVYFSGFFVTEKKIHEGRGRGCPYTDYHSERGVFFAFLLSDTFAVVLL